MIIIINKESITDNEIEQVTLRLKNLGFNSHVSNGQSRIVIGAIGENKKDAQKALEALPYVEKIVPISKPFKLVSREFKSHDTKVAIEDLTIGENTFSIMAGPCAVENKNSLKEVAKGIKQAGGKILRGGVFKPRTSPYSFQGLGEEGLKILYEAAKENELKIVTEVMDPRQIDLVSKYANILQIGARNMQNYELLKEVGNSNKPVVLKRGMSSTVEEWLMAAEYILVRDNYQVILCERGIRTFETSTRNTLDLAAVSLVKELTHLPVIVDPSHGTGKWKLVSPMSKAALAAGADGVMVEVHQSPEEACSDGLQSLTIENFTKLTQNLQALAPHFNKRMVTN
ncbi:3-deoxy-7-phosphoheptulonate synthase [Natranaerobius trueperi]|uniref:3-deoxy-7-phosphoheptulonate synthase n=1 Tax=Natranaerobius trueperi TaxID=759412 RepID=A0A226BX26_9FIRM|nr:3-deoxy-7-phosphoheptulonate synthase [Natranaerobius trueperi]OWZ83556.1 3-deoxy-7-phosphoheptulonate synthase [Natranaerobius trueperi]